jgi:hypothetical protein
MFANLLGSTLFFVREYTISCWGVHHLLLGSTPFLVSRYTMTCWGVHHLLLGSTPSPVSGVLVVLQGFLLISAA